jgi:RNA-binding protein NOB1
MPGPTAPALDATTRVLVLDAGALIAGGDALFALGGLVDGASGEAVARRAPGECVAFYTVPEVAYEARDPVARARLALLSDSVVLRAPSPRALDAVVRFAKATGDYPALSVVDIKVLALSWMLETERNGTQALREEPVEPKFVAPQTVPMQEAIQREEEAKQRAHKEHELTLAATDGWVTVEPKKSHSPHVAKKVTKKTKKARAQGLTSACDHPEPPPTAPSAPVQEDSTVDNLATVSPATLESGLDDHALSELIPGMRTTSLMNNEDAHSAASAGRDSGLRADGEEIDADRPLEDEFEDDGVGWINEENLDQHLADDIGASAADPAWEHRVGCVTTDFAMQNVILQMGMKLLSVDGRHVIRSIRRYALRCQSCAEVTRELERKFCGRCGNASLTRVTFRVDHDGSARIFLSSRFRPRLRGTKYSIPMPRGGRNNKDLVLCEDQVDPSKVRWLEKRRERMAVDVLDPGATYNCGAQHHPLKPIVVGYGSRNPNEGKPSSKKGKRK